MPLLARSHIAISDGGSCKARRFTPIPLYMARRGATDPLEDRGGCRFVKKRRDAPRIELACGDGSGEPRAERPNHASTRGWARRAFAAEEFSKRFAAASNLSSLPGSNSAATPSSEHCVIAPA